MREAPGSIEQALERLREAFQPEAAIGLSIAYQIELQGESDGGQLWLEVEGPRLEVGKGAARSPDVIFRLSATDFYGVLIGRENPDLLFMADRLKVEGKLSLALKLRKLFRTSSCAVRQTRRLPEPHAPDRDPDRECHLA